MALRASVLGGGSWGTALAAQLAMRGHDVVLWDRHPERCAAINETHRNPRYLQSVNLPKNLRAAPDLDEVVSRAELLVPVIPSHALRSVMVQAAPLLSRTAIVCCATKGFENDTDATMAEVLASVFPEERHADVSLLSGPSFALEVAQGQPTAVVIGGPTATAEKAGAAFHGGGFRAYHTEDVAGLCIGGSLKNVMAIACGVSDGVGLGLNARAALITRGLAEMTRLAVARGGHPMTMMGLGGLGDLVLTCTGNLSRNRRVGLGLGQGKQLDAILTELGEVAEGVYTARSALRVARAAGVEMPITEQIYSLLYEGKSAPQALVDLLQRERRAERD